MPKFHVDLKNLFNIEILSDIEYNKAIKAYETHKWNIDLTYENKLYLTCSICKLSGLVEEFKYTNILFINDKLCYLTCDDMIIKEIIE